MVCSFNFRSKKSEKQSVCSLAYFSDPKISGNITLINEIVQKYVRLCLMNGYSHQRIISGLSFEKCPFSRNLSIFFLCQNVLSKIYAFFPWLSLQMILTCRINWQQNYLCHICSYLRSFLFPHRIYSFIHLFSHLFVHQLFIQCLLWAKHNSKPCDVTLTFGYFSKFLCIHKSIQFLALDESSEIYLLIFSLENKLQINMLSFDCFRKAIFLKSV